jgi:hypothetical protein
MIKTTSQDNEGVLELPTRHVGEILGSLTILRSQTKRMAPSEMHFRTVPALYSLCIERIILCYQSIEQIIRRE